MPSQLMPVHVDDVTKVLVKHQIKHGIRDGKPHCTCGWVGERGEKRSPHIAQDIKDTLVKLYKLRQFCEACEMDMDGHPDIHPEGCLCDFSGQRRSFTGAIVPIWNPRCPRHPQDTG